MTSSRSRASINKLLALLVVFGVAFVPSIAEAGRKRVVVLELEGPKADKFHEDLVKLIKKTHTVVPTEKWLSTADDLDASKLTDGNIKKVAKKLKIDAIVTGKIEKRRDEYIIQLKVRAGKTGAVTGSRIDTSSESARIDAKAATDLKDELVGAIATMKSGGGGDDEEEEEEEERPKKKAKVEEEEEEEEEKPKKKSSFSKKSSDDEEEEEEEEEERKPTKKELAAKKKKEEEERKKAEAEERKAEAERKKEEALAKKEEDKRKKEEAKKKAAKKDADEEEEEEEEDETKAALKTKKDADEEEEEEEEEPKKKVAARDGDEEEEESVEASAEEGEEGPDKLSVGERAVEAVAGLSFTARKMLFTYQSDLMNHPPPYNGVPVAGLVLDVAVFPMAITHKNKSMLKNIGITLMYDKVLFINSKSDPDGPGNNAPVTLPTTQSRWAIGAIFRYPINKMFTIGGGLEYGTQSFTIKPAMGVSPGIPNTAYSAIMPTVFARVTVGKLIFGLDAAYLKIGNAGQIENADQYGPASKNGFEASLSVDYMLKKFLFARVAFRGEAIGFTFTGNGAMATNRDMDPEKDVFGASDKYYGGIATVGYLY
jgi:actin-related protein